MSRHPYTYAADFIRDIASRDGEEIVPNSGLRISNMSRSTASQIREQIAKAIGMSDADLAEKLSLAYQENELNAVARRDAS